MCLYPISAYRWTSRVNGLTGVQVYPSGVVKREHWNCLIEPLDLPCGKCLECLSHYSIEWATRCVLEANMHSQNCMLTLTYSVSDGSVHKRDVQLFIKRLRKAIDCKISYFLSGEYGKKGGRPHYHVIVFGWRPSDLEPFFQRDDHIVYKSKFVERVWFGKSKVWADLPRKPGFISVEDVNERSAKYCAKYLQKLNSVPSGATLPFSLVSTKPAIGLYAFEPVMIDRDAVYIHGRSFGLPRYFRRKFGENLEKKRLRTVRGQLLSLTLDDRRERAIQRFGSIVKK